MTGATLEPVLGGIGGAMILLGMLVALGMVTERRGTPRGRVERSILMTGIGVGAMVGLVLLLVDSLDGGAQLALLLLVLLVVAVVLGAALAPPPSSHHAARAPSRRRSRAPGPRR